MKTNNKKTPLEPKKEYIPPTLYVTTINYGLSINDISDDKTHHELTEKIKNNN